MKLRIRLAHQAFLLFREYLLNRGEDPGVYGDRGDALRRAFRALDDGDLSEARRLHTSLCRDSRGIEDRLVRLDLLLRRKEARSVGTDANTWGRFDTAWDMVCHVSDELARKSLRFPDLDLWASKDDELTVMFNAPGREQTTFLKVALAPACHSHSLATAKAVIAALVDVHHSDPRFCAPIDAVKGA